MNHSAGLPADQNFGSAPPGSQQCAGPSVFWVPGMSPADMSALAARLSRLAGEIDGVRVRLSRAAALEWASKAGEAFRQEVALRSADLAAGSSDVRTASAYVAAYAKVLEGLAAKGPGLRGG